MLVVFRFSVFVHEFFVFWGSTGLRGGASIYLQSLKSNGLTINAGDPLGLEIWPSQNFHVGRIFPILDKPVFLLLDVPSYTPRFSRDPYYRVTLGAVPRTLELR